MKLTFIQWFAEEDERDHAQAAEFLSELLLHGVKHSGDCTKESQPCNLCILENLLGEYREYYFDIPIGT